MQLKATRDTGEEEKFAHSERSLDCAAGSALQLWGVGGMGHRFLGTVDLVPPPGDGEAKRKRNLWLAFPGLAEAHPAPIADPPMT